MSAAARLHRRRKVAITAVLLGVWSLVTVLVGYLARDLDFRFFGWPFNFWLGAQGSLVVYVLIVCAYAYFMNRWDRQAGHDADGMEAERSAGQDGNPRRGSDL